MRKIKHFFLCFIVFFAANQIALAAGDAMVMGKKYRIATTTTTGLTPPQYLTFNYNPVGYDGNTVNGDGESHVTRPIVASATDNVLKQLWEFVQVPGATDRFYIKSCIDMTSILPVEKQNYLYLRCIGNNTYGCVPLTETSATGADVTDKGLRWYNNNGSNPYFLRTEQIARNIRMYANTLNSSNSTGADYQIVLTEVSFKVLLGEQIAYANTLLNSTSEGNNPGQYTEAVRNTLSGAITAAQGYLTSEDDVIICNAIDVLATAGNVYKSTMNGAFNPDVEKYYRIFAKSSSNTNLEGYAYVEAGGSRYLNYKTGVSKDQVFQFEKISEGRFRIINTLNSGYSNVTRRGNNQVAYTSNATGGTATWIMSFVEYIDNVAYYNFTTIDGYTVFFDYRSGGSEYPWERISSTNSTLISDDKYKLAIKEITADDWLVISKANLSVIVDSAKHVSPKVNIPAAIKILFESEITDSETLLFTATAAQVELLKTTATELLSLASSVDSLAMLITQADAFSEDESLSSAKQAMLRTKATEALAILSLADVQLKVEDLKASIANAMKPEEVIEPEHAKFFKIKHKPSALYMGQDVSKKAFVQESADDDSQIFLFLLVDEATNKYGIQQLSTGEFLGKDMSSTWNMLYNKEFGVDKSNFIFRALAGTDEGYFTISNELQSSNAIGTDDFINDTGKDKGIYTDKSASADLSKWHLELITPTSAQEEKSLQNIKDILFHGIERAEDALEGEGTFNQDLKGALESELELANAVYVLPTASIDDLLGAYTLLVEKAAAYLASRSTDFVPEAGGKYRIVATSDVTGLDGVIAYNGTGSNLTLTATPTGGQIADFEFEVIAGSNPVAYYIKVSGTEDYVIQDGGASSDNMRAKAKDESNPNRCQWNVNYTDQTINSKLYYTVINLQSRGLRCPTEIDGKIVRYSSLSNRDKFRIVKSDAFTGGALNDLISEANQLLSNTTEGTQSGQYLKTDRDLLSAAIASASVAVGGTEDVINAAVALLHEAVEAYKLAKLADRIPLQALVNEAQELLNQTIEGTGAGEYLPSVRIALASGMASAQIELDKEVLYQVDTDVATAIIQLAIDEYKASANLNVVDTDRVYYLLLKGGYYLGRADETEGTRVSTREMTVDETVYSVIFVPVAGAVNTYNIIRYNPESTGNEYLVNPSSYNVYFQSTATPESPTTNIRFYPVDGEDGYYYLKIERNKYLGANNVGANQNTASDKNMDSDASKWTLEEYKKGSLDRVLALTAVLVEDDYTIASWTVFAEKRTIAQNLGEGATSGQIEEAINNLQTAMSGLVNIAELKTLIDSTTSLEEVDYTVTSWSVLQARLTIANTVLTATTQDAVDVAASNLDAAKAALVNIKGLKDLIAIADTYDESKYTVVSWSTLQAALEVANSALTTINSVGDVNDELAKLQVAFNNLVDISILRVQLIALEEEGLIESDYSVVTWNAFSGALIAANEVLTAIAQDVVNAAILSLDITKTALIDVKSLKELIDSTGDLIEASYTIVSWNVLLTALNGADATVQDATTNDAVTAALNVLQDAIDKLEGKTNLSEFETAGIAIYTNNQKLYVEGLDSEVVISVYDISGRSIFNEVTSESQFIKELPTGSYIIMLKGYVNGSTIVINK